MAEHARIVRLARYRSQPGSADQLWDALHALAVGMRSLPGLFGAQVGRLREDPEWMVLVARWESESAMQATGNSAVDELVDRVGGLAEEQRVEHFVAE